MAASAGDARRRQNRWGEGELLRAEIVAAARRLLEQDGTEASVTLRGVAREADITAPSIYPHFPGREELLEAVVVAAAADLQAQVRTAVDAVGEDGDGRDRLRAYLEAYIAFGRERPASYQVVLTRPHPSEMVRPRELLGAVWATFVEAYQVLRPDLDEAAVAVGAALLWSAAHGLAILPPHQPRFPWPDSEVMLDRLLDLHLQPVPQGLGT